MTQIEINSYINIELADIPIQETIKDMMDAQLLNDYSSDKLEFVKETVKHDEVELSF